MEEGRGREACNGSREHNRRRRHSGTFATHKFSLSLLSPSPPVRTLAVQTRNVFGASGQSLRNPALCLVPFRRLATQLGRRIHGGPPMNEVHDRSSRRRGRKERSGCWPWQADRPTDRRTEGDRDHNVPRTIEGYRLTPNSGNGDGMKWTDTNHTKALLSRTATIFNLCHVVHVPLRLWGILKRMPDKRCRLTHSFQRLRRDVRVRLRRRRQWHNLQYALRDDRRVE